MAEVMSIEEIEARFDSEWVLLEDPETDDNLKVKRGRVLWHDKDRNELYRRAKEFRPRNWAVLYTGKVPDDMEIVLWDMPLIRKQLSSLFRRASGDQVATVR